MQNVEQEGQDERKRAPDEEEEEEKEKKSKMGKRDRKKYINVYRLENTPSNPYV